VNGSCTSSTVRSKRLPLAGTGRVAVVRHDAGGDGRERDRLAADDEQVAGAEDGHARPVRERHAADEQRPLGQRDAGVPAEEEADEHDADDAGRDRQQPAQRPDAHDGGEVDVGGGRLGLADQRPHHARRRAGRKRRRRAEELHGRDQPAGEQRHGTLHPQRRLLQVGPADDRPQAAPHQQGQQRDAVDRQQHRPGGVGQVEPAVEHHAGGQADDAGGGGGDERGLCRHRRVAAADGVELGDQRAVHDSCATPPARGRCERCSVSVVPRTPASTFE
jgi:hypothetical protein